MKKVFALILSIALLVAMVPAVFANDTAATLAFDEETYTLPVGGSVSVNVIFSQEDGSTIKTGIFEAVANIPEGLQAEVVPGLIPVENMARPNGNVKCIHDVTMEANSETPLYTLIITATEDAVVDQDYTLTFSDLAIVDGDYMEYTNVTTKSATISYVDPIAKDLNDALANIRKGLANGINSETANMPAADVAGVTVTWKQVGTDENVTINEDGSIVRPAGTEETYEGIQAEATVSKDGQSLTETFTFNVAALDMTQDILDARVEKVAADFSEVNADNLAAAKAALEELQKTIKTAEALDLDTKEAKEVAAELEEKIAAVAIYPFIVKVEAAGEGFKYTVTPNDKYKETTGEEIPTEYIVAVQLFDGSTPVGLFADKNTTEKEFMVGNTTAAKVIVLSNMELAPVATLAESVVVPTEVTPED